LTNHIIDKYSGQLNIAEGFEFSKKTKPAELLAYFRQDEVNVKDIGNGYFHYFIRNVPIETEHFSFVLIFYRGQLDTILFGFDYSPDDTWENWSEEKELRRAEKYNKWLTRQIGTARNFWWGSAWADFDAKSGWSGLGLRFKNHE